MNIPKGTLVMMVKRGKTIIVPNGQLPLEKGDILLCLSDETRKLQDAGRENAGSRKGEDKDRT